MCIVFAQCSMWSSSRCILMGIVATGNAEWKLSKKLGMTFPLDDRIKFSTSYF